MIEIPQAEDLIAYCARVSNPDNQDNFKTSDRLLRYCIDHQHWSIFEMVHVVMEIKTTRDIGRQILRHRSFSFQEFSQRYAEVDFDDFDYREARLQDTKNRQNSVITDDPEVIEKWMNLQDLVVKMAVESYKTALKLGIAKEQARALLPEGLTPSVMYMAGSLRSWIHYCELRRDKGTQKEHREIADKCWELLTHEFEFLKTHGEAQKSGL
jgi:thymidylate synthase (FAD)